jgi:hypothetical protein
VSRASLVEAKTGGRLSRKNAVEFLGERSQVIVGDSALRQQMDTVLADVPVFPPCHRLGVCRTQCADIFREVIHTHTALQREMYLMIPDQERKAGDTILYFHGESRVSEDVVEISQWFMAIAAHSFRPRKSAFLQMTAAAFTNRRRVQIMDRKDTLTVAPESINTLADYQKLLPTHLVFVDIRSGTFAFHHSTALVALLLQESKVKDTSWKVAVLKHKPVTLNCIALQPIEKAPVALPSLEAVIAADGTGTSDPLDILCADVLDLADLEEGISPEAAQAMQDEFDFADIVADVEEKRAANKRRKKKANVQPGDPPVGPPGGGGGGGLPLPPSLNCF